MDTSTIWNIACLVITFFLVIISSLIAIACYSLFGSYAKTTEVVEPTSWATVLRNNNRIIRAKRYQPNQNPFKPSRRKSMHAIEGSYI